MKKINRALGRRVRAKSDRAEQTNLVRIIGQRMRAAREMTNLSQLEAAKQLGYETSAKLSKIEGATEGSVPLLTVAKASKLYDVSTDFLLGVSEDWEIDPAHSISNETSAWIGEAWEQTRRRDLEVLVWVKRRTDAVDTSIPNAYAASLRLKLAFEQFMALNPEFEDMKGGNRLAMAVDKVIETAAIASRQHEKYKNDLRAMAKSTPQLNLFINDD